MKHLLLLVSIFISLYSSELSDALKKADEQKLYKSRYWNLLLHMKSGKSEIDSDNFFLSSEGKVDAEAELKSTLISLYEKTDLEDNASQCRFPARTEFLKERLELKNLPEVECIAFETLLQKMDPQRVSLIFPSAHINSPASSFGHTFLRIDSSMDSKLLSYAVNYAANGNDEDFFYALNGLFGKYPGYYSMMPYYEKLKEYSDTESRDIWEYDLNLNHDEVMRLVRHIWELQHIYSDYFFIDENCSYNMLWLLEVARPSLDLHDAYLFSVAPPETLFAIKEQNLVSNIEYRPSKRTKLLAYEKKLSLRGLKFSKAIAWGEKKSQSVDGMFNLEEQQLILESASEFLEYLYIQAKVDKEQYLKRFHAILTQRAALGSSQDIEIKTPQDPTTAHRINRVNLQVGLRDGKKIGFLGFRHAFNDLRDSDTGLLRGTQIEFLDTLLSYDENSDFKVENLTLLSITSIAPLSSFFQPFSWRLKTGWDNLSLDDNKTEFMMSVGIGQSIGGESWYSYIMLDPIAYVDHYSDLGLGASFGVVVDEGRYLKSTLEVSERYFLRQKDQYLLNFDQLVKINANNALHINYEYTQKLIRNRETVKLVYNYFF